MINYKKRLDKQKELDNKSQKAINDLLKKHLEEQLKIYKISKNEEN